MERYEYKVERITCDLESYLNKMANDGWRCVSVSHPTGLGWSVVVVLERKIN